MTRRTVPAEKEGSWCRPQGSPRRKPGQPEYPSRTLFWPLLSRYGRWTGALNSFLLGITTGTALDPTHSRPHRTGSARSVSPRLHQTPSRGSTAGEARRPRQTAVRAVPHAFLHPFLVPKKPRFRRRGHRQLVESTTLRL